ARGGLSVLVIEKGIDGGQIAATDKVENYPGQVLEGESGESLSKRMALQAERFGAVKVQDVIAEASLDQEVKELRGQKETYLARYVILAMGASARPIGCKGEERFKGSGISYCATCDGNFFTGLDVYVAGGGDAAVEEAVFLTRFARKVTIVHRRNQLRAAKSIQEKAFQNPKISFLWDSVVEEAYGEGVLQGLVIRNVKTGELTRIEADPADGMLGLFGFVGNIPSSALVKGIVDMDEKGYIQTDEDMRTSLKEVYAAGDIRVKNVRQVVTAAADGAVAAVHISAEYQPYV
ncbi:MAG: FAD-dependent oxidoreductase, partial [Dorea sp.]|nr:FAD-dependent oxidoreductase [Dorea sp.]